MEEDEKIETGWRERVEEDEKIETGWRDRQTDRGK